MVPVNLTSAKTNTCENFCYYAVIQLITHPSSLKRFDSSTVELLLWYEAIFGKEMWRHVVTETTFWKHSEAAAMERLTKRNLNDTIQESLWREKIHEVP